jgi:hypothetical protein
LFQRLSGVDKGAILFWGSCGVPTNTKPLPFLAYKNFCVFARQRSKARKTFCILGHAHMSEFARQTVDPFNRQWLSRCGECPFTCVSLGL